jgi:hypothetical protein
MDTPDPRPHPRDYEAGDHYLAECRLPTRRQSRATDWIVGLAAAALAVLGVDRLVTWFVR